VKRLGTLGRLLVLGMVTAPALAAARPVEESPRLQPISTLDSPSSEVRESRQYQTFPTASQDTTYFGGTFWNPDSARWEALRDSAWTFDTGVGSSFNHSLPGVNPYKDPSLHATMEGWIGWDVSYSELTYFRRMGVGDFTEGPPCVGSPAGLEGNYSMWVGVLPEEALYLSYSGGQGYGNGWNICIGHAFTSSGSPAALDFERYVDSEPGYDFARVVVDTVGTGDLSNNVTAWEAAGQLPAGHESVPLMPGHQLPRAAGPVVIKFCFQSDGAWSDEDSAFLTECGPFAVDVVQLSGGITYDPATFETGDDGWEHVTPERGKGGEWSNLVAVGDLPDPMTPCGCDLRDSVLVFEDLDAGGHGRYQDNLAASPWIDLLREGLAGSPGKFVEFQVYSDLPILNYLFIQVNLQTSPVHPLDGLWRPSPWFSTGFVYYFGGVPQCTNGGTPVQRIDFSSRADPGAEQVRLALGVISYCRFFANCSGVTNSSPWFDRVRFGAYGPVGGPILSSKSYDLPHDAFPANGTPNLNATARVDCGVIKGAASPEVGTSTGDTLIVHGQGDGLEVRVQFAIRPGPGVSASALGQFLARTRFEETRRGLDWYSARMDTAEQGGSVAPGTWMTAFHEEDPAFSGSDTDLDPSDLDYGTGRQIRLKNDIFPDNLLTPGSRLELFYKGRFLGRPVVSTYPDTTDGNYLEMEVLPSSMAADGSHNCVLYVDHSDNTGAQRYIEEALGMALPGGSPNAENTAWDRWDARGSGTNYGFFGRPLNTEYGATVYQILQLYHTIIWNSGNSPSYNLKKEDGDLLVPWLTLDGFSDHAIYLSGDGLVQSSWVEKSSEPSAWRLVNEECGVSRVCDTFSAENCPPGTAADESPCPRLDPVTGSQVSRFRSETGSRHAAQGSGCPDFRSFDVMVPDPAAPYGPPKADEQYVGAGKTALYASVSNAGTLRFGNHFQTVVDGVSLDERRDPWDCTASPASPLPLAILQRMSEVLIWFRACPNTGIGVPPEPGPGFTTSLAAASPNPLRGGAGAHIRFSLARSQRVQLVVYDLRGARVRVLLDGPAVEGWNEAVWDGADASGRPVADGVYFYRLTAEDAAFSKKLVVLGR